MTDVGIVRQFPFSSSMQRMAVIVRSLGGDQFELFCKGSPEKIMSLSRPESGLDTNIFFHPFLLRTHLLSANDPYPKTFLTNLLDRLTRREAFVH